jgi:hypothetical protein
MVSVTSLKIGVTQIRKMAAPGRHVKQEINGLQTLVGVSTATLTWPRPPCGTDTETV